MYANPHIKYPDLPIFIWRRNKSAPQSFLIGSTKLPLTREKEGKMAGKGRNPDSCPGLSEQRQGSKLFSLKGRLMKQS